MGRADTATNVSGISGYTLPFGWQYRPLPNRRVQSTISPPLETDFVSMQLIGWGQSKNGFTIESHQAAMDAQLETSDGTVLAQTNLTPGTSTFLSLEGQPPGEYFVQLRGTEPRFTTYDISGRPVGIQADAFEPDNEMVAAEFLEAGLGSRERTIHRVADVDWFRFELERVGKSQNQISIEYMGPQDNLIGEGILELQIYDSSGTPLGTTSVEDGVQVAKLTGLQPGEYFARVSGANSNTNSYRLRYDLVTTSRLPFVIGKDGYPVTRITNSPAIDDDPLVQEGIVYWALSESDSEYWDLMMFDTTTPNARPQPIAQDVDSRSSDPPLFHVESHYIAWQAHDGQDYEIYLYDGSLIRRLTSDGNDDRNPRLAGQSRLAKPSQLVR